MTNTAPRGRKPVRGSSTMDEDAPPLVRELARLALAPEALVHAVSSDGSYWLSVNDPAS